MRLSTSQRILPLLALLATAPAWAQTARTAADLERPDVQEATGVLARGETLLPFQKALLDEIGYAPAQEFRSGRYLLTSVAGASPAPVIARPSGQPTPLSASRAQAILLQEDFSSVTAGTGTGTSRVPGTVPAGWTAVPATGVGAWGGFTNAAYGSGTNKFLSYDDDASGSGGTLRDYILTAPSVSSVGSATVFVVFDYSYRPLGTAERYSVEYSTDGGTTWLTGIANLPSTAAGVTSLYPLSVDYQVALPAGAGNQADLRVRFRYNDASGYNYYGSVDNVRISTTSLVAPPSCATLIEPADAATGLEGPLYFNWSAPTSGAVPSGYKVSIGLDNPPTSIANGALFTAGPIILSGATPNTTYYWQVVPTGGGGDAVGCPVRSFTTKALGTVTAFPWVETFDASTNNGAVVARAFGELPGWFNRAGGQDFFRTAASTDTEPISGATVDHTSGTGRMAWLDDSTPPTATGAQWWSPRLDLTQVANPQLKFWYQNVANGNTTVTALSTLNVFASTDNGVTFSPSLLTVSARVNTWTEYTVSLNPYAASTGVIVLFSVNEGTGSTSDPSLDDVSVVAGPTSPVAAVTPATGATLALGTGGACSTSPAPQTVRIANTSGGTLTTGTGTLSGANADQFTVSGGPASLGGGFSTTYTVTFTPTFGTVGAQTATLTIPYDDGTAQTLTYSLTGTANATNVADGTGAGIQFRNALTGACTAASTAPAPSGTGFISIASHTQVAWDAVGSGDDSYFILTPAVLDAVGGVRLFGTTYRTLNINSNGLLGSKTAVSGVPNTQPSATFGAAIAAFAQDLTLTTAYDTPDPAQYNVGAYYGVSDADGDGAADDFVVTWFHAYDYNSPTYADPAARYATFQLVVTKANRPNEDDTVEIRFPTGNDAAGVPYSRNTATAGTPTLENDALIAMYVPNTSTGAIAQYRQDTSGGPVFLGSAPNAVRFTPQTQATATGGAGFRMMGSPLTDATDNVATVERLAGMNLVQSVVGQFPDFAQDILFTSYTGAVPYSDANYVAAANVTDRLLPGQGFLWYLFNQNITPSPTSNGNGTSRSFALPMALQATGLANTGNVSRTLNALSATNDGFTMLANPFRAGLDVSGAAVASWAGGAGISNVLQTWDPATGSYVLPGNLPTPNVMSAWQGFFVESTASTSLTIPATAAVANGGFVGRPADAPATALAFRLDGTDAATGAATTDLAAALTAPAAGAADGWDGYDASKLAPLAAVYATIGFEGTHMDGSLRVKAQESRARDAAGFDVPLVVDAVGTAPRLTLSWDGLDALPATWALELRDLVTGATVDMRTAGTYAFDQVASPALADASPASIIARTTTAAQAKAGSAPRFVLHVAPRGATAAEGDAVTEFALAAPAPNPTAGTARVAFALPEATTVSVVLYDALGRRVATLAEGQMAAGRHEARLDAGALAPGVYVVRMQAGTFAATQRMTVVR